MLCNSNKKDNLSQLIPKVKINDEGISADEAAEIIENLLLDEGQAKQNLATFCQTHMEYEATELLSKLFAKNAIDKSEYPSTAEIESSCVNMIANLWHASEAEGFIGTSAVGSSEACIGKPNLVISSAYQVCWEKFCRYWDVEMRNVPVDEKHLSINTDTVMDYVDENTIGIVGVLGLTYTGMYDDIYTLDKKVSSYNKTHDHQLVIHVDGASGGLYAPFVQPELY